MSQPEQVDMPKEEEGVIVCPCCGKKTLPKPLKLKNELTDHWLACMMSGVPFNHTYSLYDGRVTVTATSLSVDTADNYMAATTLLSELEADEKNKEFDVNLLNLRNLLNIFTFIAKIELKVNNEVKVYKPAEVALHAIDSILKLRFKLNGDTRKECFDELKKLQDMLSNTAIISTLPPGLLFKVANIHNTLNSLIVDSGIDGSFWLGIELA